MQLHNIISLRKRKKLWEQNITNSHVCCIFLTSTKKNTGNSLMSTFAKNWRKKTQGTHPFTQAGLSWWKPRWEHVWLEVIFFGPPFQNQGQTGSRYLWICSYREILYIIYLEPMNVLYFWAEKPSKTRPFPIKARVIWVPGVYIYIYKMCWMDSSFHCSLLWLGILDSPKQQLVTKNRWMKPISFCSKKGDASNLHSKPCLSIQKIPHFANGSKRCH